MKIVVLSGSVRTGSVNRKVAGIAARTLKERSADVRLVDLGQFVAPVYNADIERAEGLPESMSRLKRIIAGANGLAISTPEYNGFVPPLLVNAFSWVSRPEGDEASCAAFAGKVAAVMAASPGSLGGVRVVPRLRDFLAELGVTVVPGFVTIRSAYGAFEEDGSFTDGANLDAVAGLMTRLVAALQCTGAEDKDPCGSLPKASGTTGQ